MELGLPKQAVFEEVCCAFNTIQFDVMKDVERARVSVQIPAALRWARAFCLGGVGSPCRGKYGKLDYVVGFANNVWNYPHVCQLQASGTATFQYFGPCQIWFSCKVSLSAMHDPSDVHCPGDEVLQRHGSKAGGQKYLGALWCESHASSINFDPSFIYLKWCMWNCSVIFTSSIIWCKGGMDPKWWVWASWIIFGCVVRQFTSWRPVASLANVVSPKAR